MKREITGAIMIWVTHASRVLVSVSRRNGLFSSADYKQDKASRKSLPSPDACVTRNASACRRSALVAGLLLAALTLAHGLTPGDLGRVRFEQHPGQQISGDLTFRDETGRSLEFGDLLGKKPVILVPGYYRCPMLCTMINDGLINALQNLRANVGTDFDVVDLSIDPTEKPEAAAEKKALYLRRYGRTGAAEGWHCLVGRENSIAQLANELGYRFIYDSETKEYAHPSGVVIITRDGKISRYIFGVTFSATELRDALAAAKEGKSESAFSQLLLLCYHYNPITGKYGHLILSILRFTSVATLIAVIGFVALMVGREKASPARIRARRTSLARDGSSDGPAVRPYQ